MPLWLEQLSTALPQLKQVCVQLLRTLTTWHCPQPAASRRAAVSVPLRRPAAAAIDQYLLPAGPTAANPPAAALLMLLLWAHAGTDRRTDGWTDNVPLNRPCPGNVNELFMRKLLFAKNLNTLYLF